MAETSIAGFTIDVECGWGVWSSKKYKIVIILSILISFYIFFLYLLKD